MKTPLTPPYQMTPSLLDLGKPLEKILRVWGAGPLQHRSLPLDGIEFLPLERMVLFSGTLRGCLVFRGTREFASWLRTLRENPPPDRYDETGIFEDLVSLFSLYLCHEFWTPQSFQVGPLRPFRSLPMDWPERDADSLCALSVADFHLEIRLWRD